MKRILTGLVLGLCLAVWGTSGVGQTCESLCNRDWWQNASKAEVEREISSANLNARNSSGVTPLMYVAESGTAGNIVALVKAGADVNARDLRNGWTALMYAATFGSVDNIPVLLRAGANVNPREENGRTALMYAALFGSLDNVRALVEAGADVKIRDKAGWTAWMFLEERFEGREKTEDYWKTRDVLWTDLMSDLACMCSGKNCKAVEAGTK